MTGRRRAKRGGNQTAKLFGAPVDADVMRHLLPPVNAERLPSAYLAWDAHLRLVASWGY